MNTIAHGIIGVGLVTTVLFVSFSRIPGEKVDGSSPEPMTQVTALKGSAHVLFGHQPELVRIAVWSPGESGLDIVTRESGGGKLFQWQRGVTVPFALQDVSCRHAEELYLAGKEVGGDHVIVRLTSQPAEGAMTSSHPISQAGVGVESPLAATVVALNGSSFIPPSERPFPIPPSRKIVFRSSSFGGFRAVVPDPERRFLLIQEETTGNVFQLDTTGSISLVVSSSEFPVLLDGILQTPLQVRSEERVFLIGDPVMAVHDGWVLLQDIENDGLFESAQFLTWEEKKEFFPTRPDGGDWRSVSGFGD